MNSHILEFEDTTNFRELGGYPAADGRIVKYGLFYRSGTLNDIKSDNDRKLLESLGLKVIFDYRSSGEREVSPDYIPPGAEYFPISAMRYANGDEVDFSPAGMKRLQEEYGETLSRSVIEMLMGYYARMPFNNPAYKELFRALEEGRTPLLFHCTAGKDRTGVGAMLILLALGASRETVVEDYLETNKSRAEEIEQLRQNFREVMETNPEEYELRLIQFGVLPKFINASLDAIIERYGSWEEYFDSEFGLDREGLNALRDKYLVPDT